MRLVAVHAWAGRSAMSGRAQQRLDFAGATRSACRRPTTAASTPACTSSQPQAWAASRRWRSQSSRASRCGVGPGWRRACRPCRACARHGPRPAGAGRGCPARTRAASPSAARRCNTGERLRAAVDEVAEQVDAVARRRECRSVASRWSSGIAAALEVAYQIVHRPILLRSRAFALPWAFGSSPEDAHGASVLPVVPPDDHTAPHSHLPFSMDVALLFFLIVLNAAFRDVGNGVDGQPKGAPAGDAGGRRSAARRRRSTCTTIPTKFLSTVQVGITSISVLNGIVGDAAFSEPLGEWLHATFGMGAASRPYHRHRDGGADHHGRSRSSSASWCPSASARCFPRRWRAIAGADDADGCRGPRGRWWCCCPSHDRGHPAAAGRQAATRAAR